MNDRDKKSKVQHGRHAAPAVQHEGAAMSEDASSGVQNESLGDAVPFGMSPQRVYAPQVGPANTTAPMPHPVRPVSLHDAPRAQAATAGYAPVGPMLPVDVGETDTRSRRRPLKIVGIVLGVLLGLLVVVYVAGAIVFMDRFMPRTTIGAWDVSLKTSAEVQDILVDALDGYELDIDGQGFTAAFSAEDVGMKIDGTGITDSMHADMNPWAWPLEITRAHDESEKLAATYNESGLGDAVADALDEFNGGATPPTDATIAYDDVQAAFEVQPESVGTMLDYDAVIAVVDEAVMTMQPSVTLTQDELVQPTVYSTDPKLDTAAQNANNMITADLVLTMAGSTVAQINADLISQWIRLDDNLSTTLDESALTAWVDELATACNTVGTQRTYTRSDGKVVTVSGGPYGWSVDRDTLLGIVRDGVSSGTVNTVAVPCSTTGTAYNGIGARDWGSRYLDIDLSEQYVRFYDETGTIIWESACISGKPDGEHDTSTGVFWLNTKQSPSKLIGYRGNEKIYETTVQYWMPFDGNAIGLHDADWQPSFGGTMYKDGYGSHGCVNLPPAKAAALYSIIQSGDVVVSHQ